MTLDIIKKEPIKCGLKVKGVIDDSSQRILAAEILMHERAADGAAMLRRILEGRIQQYFQFYEESLVPD